jgi:localization factor PodJL
MSAAPWSVKGIDPKAREVAKDLARRSGMTLGEWLNRMILEDETPEEVTAESQFGPRLHRPHEIWAPRAAPEMSQEFARVAASLDRLTERIESAESRAGLAINGVEHSVREALARIDAAEREQQAHASRFETLFSEGSAQQAQLSERLRRLEAQPTGPRSAEVLRALESRLARIEPDVVVETVLLRLGDRLADAESRTTAAIGDLKSAMGALDRRLSLAEQGGSAEAELKFEALAEVLGHRVEALRNEVADKLAASAGPQVERRLAEMEAHVRDAEARTARTVEEIGQKIVTMAEAVTRRMAEVDQRGADAIDQVGSEVARIAGAVEQRLARAEHAQAEAFERFGSELARVSDSLGDRLAASESRTARALEDLGAQVERIRMRGGEPLGPPPEPELEPEAGVWRTSAPEAAAAAEALLGPPPEPEPEVAAQAETPDGEQAIYPPWRRLDLDVPETKVPESFAPIHDPDEELFADEGDGEPWPGPQLSTREVIERAQAAARANEIAQGAKAMKKMRAEKGRRGFFGALAVRPRRGGSAMQTALMVAGGAAFLSVGAAGLVLMERPKPQNETAEISPIGSNPRASVALAPGFAARSASPDDAAASSALVQVRADVEAGIPGASSRLKALADAGDAQAQLYLAQLYEDGAAGLPQDMAEARRLVTLAAEAGEPRAMHNLGVFTFRGEGGPQDRPGAVAWFEKAAAAGVVESQYNLGVIYQAGAGVPKDLAKARMWFQRAADRGDDEARQALAALPGTGPAPETAIAEARPSTNVRQTQIVLARLGYYDGPADGYSSPAYRSALAAYQRDLTRGARAPAGER